MKLNGHNPVDLIINHRKLIEKVFTILVVFSLICIPMVGINYDLTKYLPDSSPSAQALDIMEDEFTYPGMGRVMLHDVTLYEAKNIKDRIADVEGVDMVMWADMTANIYGSSEFIDYDDIDDYYHEDDQSAYMDVIFEDKDSSSQTHKAVRQIEQIVGDRGLVAGSAVSDTNLGPTINKEVARVMVLAVIIIYIILTITTTSWFEPVMFLSVLGIAIIINMGSNIILGEISFLSNAVGAVLQLACSMDYSIFLLHSFTQERAQGIEPEQAMANAWRSAFSSIFASGMTTIVGFAAMCLMNFGIGPDMGVVLAKGITISLVTVLLLMPALILRFQDIVAKTQHRPFLPQQSRGMGNFAYRIRRPLFILVLLIIIPCYIAQGMANFTYGNEAVANSPGTPVYEAEQQMNAAYGKSNMMIALVPLDSSLTEKAMTDEIDDLPYVKYALSLSSVLPEGIPEDFLPENITSIMHSKNWARVIINVRSSGESDDAFKFADNIRGIVDQYYPNERRRHPVHAGHQIHHRARLQPRQYRFAARRRARCRAHLQGAHPALRRSHPDRVRDLHQYRSSVHLRSAHDVSRLHHRRLHPARRDHRLFHPADRQLSGRANAGRQKGSRHPRRLDERGVGHDLRHDRYDRCLRPVLYDLGRGDLQSGPPDRPRRIHFGHHGTVLPANVSDDL